MKTNTILVAEDEPDMRELVNRALTRDGFAVITAEDGELALLEIRRAQPDLAILDLMMPKMTGLEVCRALRAHPSTAAIPLIMVSAKAAEVDRVVAFEIGVDDFVTKPFSPRELVLRVRAILRHARSKGEEKDDSQVGTLRLQRSTKSVTVEGQEVVLTSAEYKLLQVLLEQPEMVHSRESLLRTVWNEEQIELRSIDTQVRRLRAKLGDAAQYIETIRAFGYRATATAASGRPT